MTKSLLRTVAIMAVVLAGCVSAYDPAAPSPFGITPRAEEVGTAPERPAVEHQAFWRWRRFFGGHERTQAKAAPPAQPPPPQVAAAQPQPEQPAPAAPNQPAPAAQQPQLVQPMAELPPQPAQATQQPADKLVSPPAEPVQVVLDEPGATIPDTPAGKQLAWWISILRGASTKAAETHFNPDFLKQVPAAQLRDVARQWRRDEFADGPVELVRLDPGKTPDRFTALVRGVNTDRYTQIKLGVDPAGRISTLWLGPVVGMSRGDITSWAKLDARFAQMPGTIAFSAAQIGPDGSLHDLHTVNGDAPLAIGSTFKLYILGALAEQIAAGNDKWDAPLAIKDDWKSLPSGRMQLEMEGAEFPLSQYADMMISISDNTAADHLLFHTGRDKVEAYMNRLNSHAALNHPFLSTMEMFRIKLGTDRTLADRYAAADEAARRAMIAPGGVVSQSTPSFAGVAMWKAPYHITDIEWFATAPDLCKLMADLHRLEQQPVNAEVGHALRINPGLQFDPKEWTSIAYKGGSEPGVLNMTWLLQRQDGQWFVMSFGWNDPKKDVDLKAAAEVVGAAVKLVAGEGK